MPLLMHPIPIEGESAGGFLVRASELNACGGIFHLLNGTRIKINEPSLIACLLDRTRFRHLASLLGLHSDSPGLVPLRVGASRRDGRYHNQVGIPDICFRRQHVNVFCPSCLDASDFWRQRWLIQPLSSCTRHECLLLEGCSVCGATLRLGRPHLNRCGECKTKLSEFGVQPVDVSAQRVAERMIDRRQHEKVAKVLGFWSALTDFDGAGDHPYDEYARLNFAVQFVTREDAAVAAMLEIVEARRMRVHPRIQLLPFLKGDKALAKFAERVLQKVPRSEIPGTGHPQFKYLSKGDAATILQLSKFQLDTAIRTAQIAWPGGGRAQRIATAEIETSLHDVVLNLFRLCDGGRRKLHFDANHYPITDAAKAVFSDYELLKTRMAQDGELSKRMAKLP